MTGAPLEVSVDRSACRGSAVCVSTAPASFALDAERRATVLDPPGDSASQLLAAERSCPNFAIRVVRKEETLHG